MPIYFYFFPSKSVSTLFSLFFFLFLSLSHGWKITNDETKDRLLSLATRFTHIERDRPLVVVVVVVVFFLLLLLFLFGWCGGV